jgi:hypothetical protein
VPTSTHLGDRKVVSCVPRSTLLEDTEIVLECHHDKIN